MQKFREYVLNSNRIARLTAKYENIRATLGDKSRCVSAVLPYTCNLLFKLISYLQVVIVHTSSHPNLDGEGNSGVLTLTRRPNTGRRRRIGNNANMGRQTKLFGGSLEEYLEETNQVTFRRAKFLTKKKIAFRPVSLV